MISHDLAARRADLAPVLLQARRDAVFVGDRLCTIGIDVGFAGLLTCVDRKLAEISAGLSAIAAVETKASMSAGIRGRASFMGPASALIGNRLGEGKHDCRLRRGIDCRGKLSMARKT